MLIIQDFSIIHVQVFVFFRSVKGFLQNLTNLY